MRIPRIAFYVLVTLLSIFASLCAAFVWLGDQDQHLILRVVPFKSIRERSLWVFITFLPMLFVFWIFLKDNIKFNPLSVNRVLDLLIALSILFCFVLIGAAFFIL